jgi:hypothetical protein
MRRGQMIVSLRPQAVFGIALSPSLGYQLGSEFILRCADVVEEFVEGFGTELLSSDERSKDIDEQ